MRVETGQPLWVLSHRCDRRNDCGDYSDERDCSYPTCQESQFTCQNGRCIRNAFVCDEENDCGDESDELEHLCHTPEATCPPHQFKCDNGHCVEMVKVCNHLDDCSDNSDEKGCGEYSRRLGRREGADGLVWILSPSRLARTLPSAFCVHISKRSLLLLNQKAKISWHTRQTHKHFWGANSLVKQPLERTEDEQIFRPFFLRALMNKVPNNGQC